MVTVDFSSRELVGKSSRRGATLELAELFQGFSSVVPRRNPIRPADPWTRVHGYRHRVAPRLLNSSLAVGERVLAESLEGDRTGYGSQTAR
jgi:hypothetical protein